VVGIGGLGHIAIKILNAWGCDVTAISSNAEKENDARMFGASHFLHSREPNDLKSYPNSFDKKKRLDLTGFALMLMLDRQSDLKEG